MGKARMNNVLAENDFISAEFDVREPHPVDQMLVILSTPHTGSALLNELIYLNGLCLPASYLEHVPTMVTLAKRWGAVRDNRIALRRYTEALARHRTFNTGWLGLSVRGSHIPLFNKARRHMEIDRLHCVHLRRRSTVEQAVSIYVAGQTAQPNGRFRDIDDTGYSFQGIRHYSTEIMREEFYIESFLKARGRPCTEIFFEDLIADTRAQLRRVPGLNSYSQLRTDGHKANLDDNPSPEFVRRFSREFMGKFGNTQFFKVEPPRLSAESG